MPFNCLEFTVAYLRWLSFRIFLTAATSSPDVPFPLNRRMGGGSLSAAGGSQPVRATDAAHAMSWMIRFFTNSSYATNDQLTDGGPPGASEPPDDSSWPPFGAAAG